MSGRYQVQNESCSAHCCFTHTVVDTHKPLLDGDGQFLGEDRYESVCECFDQECADLVAKALNNVPQQKEGKL